MNTLSWEPPVIQSREIVRRFPTGDLHVTAVNGVSLDVHQGEFLVILGRSGSGKTTLLNLLGGLDRPTSGTIHWKGQNTSAMSDKELTSWRRQNIGFVFQSFGLLPLLSAYENVELALRIRGVKGQERRGKALQALQNVGLASRAKHRPYELSGGEQQRVAIARALAVNPAVILADEPTGDLDSATGKHIAQLLKDVTGQMNVAMVVATHDLTFLAVADRVEEIVDGVLKGGAVPMEASRHKTKDRLPDHS